MERRTYNRLPVRLDAMVHDQKQQAWNAIIDNFGFDGLCLSWQSKKSIPQSIVVGEQLEVKFTIEPFITEPRGENTLQNEIIDYHLKVKVVRVLENGLAVALFNPSLGAIAQLSEKQLQEGILNKPDIISGLNKKSINILEAVEQSFIKNQLEIMASFFSIVRDVMFEQAEKSANNTEQTHFFDALNTLNKSKNSLNNQFLKQLEKHLYSHSKKHQSDSKKQNLDELELLDQHEFENWLAVNQLIVHISPIYEQELLEIELRLAKLLETDAKEVKNNPFSPEIIFKSFSEAIHTHFSNNDILLVLYQQFEKVVNEHLFDVYKEINQIFIDNNILAFIEKKKLLIVKEPSANKEPSAGGEQKQKPSIDRKPSPVQSSADLIQNAKQAYQTHQSSVAQHSTTGVAQNIGNLYQEHVPGIHLSEANTIGNSVNLQPAYQALKELLSFQKGQELEIPSDDFFASEDYKIELNFLINELTLVQHEQADSVTKNGIVPFDLTALVQNCINKEIYSAKLKNEFAYALDIIKHIFTSIDDDSWLGQPIKKLLSLFQIPLFKVFLLDKTFFESPSNPARILINKLALVDFYDENNKFYLEAHTFVVFILENYNKDLQVFSKVQKNLTELIEIQSEDYNKNVSQVIIQWNAQQFVTNEYASRLEGQSIPLSIADFISYQWLPVLVDSYLKQGQDSSQWRQYIQVLDMLILRINGDISDELIDKDVILYIIKQGLEESGQYNKKIINDVEAFLIGGESDSGILLDYETIVELLVNGYALSDKSAIARINKDVADKDTESSTDKSIAQRLKVYDYLSYKQKNKNIRVQFVWSDKTKNVFVFSGRTGQQQFVFNCSEVASMLDNEQLSQTKDYDVPLLERCFYATLGDVHDNIAKEGVIDKLTGLINQREFIRLMTDEMQQRKQTNQTGSVCALCLINIDHFSLINNTCSYEAGDQYLIEITRVIRKNLPPDAIFARYGTDEFIVLLPDCPPVEALKLLEVQRKAISQCQFNWKDKDFAMTASIGMIAISEYNEVGVFLKAVVTASAIAKEMGRNRIHTIEHDDIELSHRQELEHWATKVDQMIKNNQLDIRCQRLHPLTDGIGSHYEMLLLVKDEQGAYMPPAEFIEAAELYNKMAEVDCWVIRYVFDWFNNHSEQLELMGGIAINISGQSLNDIGFYPFIQDVFSQYPSIPPEKICFEITETMAISNMGHASNIIYLIKEMGCEFSLDDFGTGLSSYAYLKNLPVDYLKIDGVFIKEIASNPADRAMVKSINEIGHFLGMKTVAEYVENDEIIIILKDIGVDFAQGFGVEKPILISEYMHFVNSKEAKKTQEKLNKLCRDLEATL